MVELLAPAKNITSLQAAIQNKANSIYIGIEDHNMRANMKTFKQEELPKITKLCHENNVKLYLCTNTIMTNDSIKKLEKQLDFFEKTKIDALIISDLGAINIAQNTNIPLHMSIQANTSNYQALNFLEKHNITRAILSRELNLKQIKEIKKESPIEIETFIHGAMCMAISGRCFLSQYFDNKSANCGKCLQHCRKEWTIQSQDKTLQIETPYEDTYKNRLLSPKDLCMIEHIPELIDAKIDAFKIEGRAKSPDYVATVVNTYNQAIKAYENNTWNETKINKWKKQLKTVFNRGFDTGFYYKTPYKTSKDNKSTEQKIDIGQVENYYKNIKVAEIKLWSTLEINDKIIIQGNKTGSITQTVKSMQINKKSITKAKNQNIGLKIDKQVRKSDHVYKIIKRK
ncbi:MAG: peptidase U32 family protein [Methanobacteriaceae archaeon]|nr:peptidase U32 family protein [Methanobacteriaceae archaeon]